MGRAVAAESLTSGQRDLAERYVPLAKSVARIYAEQYPKLADEILSDLFLVLCRAAVDYDPKPNGAKFGGYVRDALHKRARRTIALALRRQDRCRTGVEFEVRVGPVEHQVDATHDTKLLMRHLNARERTIIERVYFGQMPISRAHQGLCNRSAGDKAVRRALKKMRRDADRE